MKPILISICLWLVGEGAVVLAGSSPANHCPDLRLNWIKEHGMNVTELEQELALLTQLQQQAYNASQGGQAETGQVQTLINQAEARLWAHVRLRHSAEEISRIETLASRINEWQKGRITLFRFVMLDIAQSRLKQSVAQGIARDPATLPSSSLLQGGISQDYIQFAGVQDGASNATFADYQRMLPLLHAAGVTTHYVMPHYPHGGDTGYSIIDQFSTRQELAAPGESADQAFQQLRASFQDKFWMIDFVPSHVDADHALVQRALSGDAAAQRQIVGIQAEDLISIEPFAHPETGEPHVRYRTRELRDGQYVEIETVRNLEFPDRREHHLVERGGGFHSHHTFTSRQFDLVGHDEMNILDVFRFLAHWGGQGIYGIRADAVPFWYKPWGSAGKHEMPSHALNELYVDFMRGINPRAEWAPEVVAGAELVSTYAGHQISVDAHATGSEASAVWNFELAHLVKDAVALNDAGSLLSYLNGRRSALNIPQGVIEILPAHKHDEYELGFSPPQSRDRFKQLLVQQGGWVSASGWSGGGRLADLFGRDPARMQLYFELLSGLPGAISVYQGDLFGVRTNWPYAWQMARERLQEMHDNQEISSGEYQELSALLQQQDPNSQPHSQRLNRVLDVRDLHRGPIPESVIAQAEAGQNPYFNRLRSILPTRHKSLALSKGGREQVIRPVSASQPDSVVSFTRSYQGSASQDRVLVLANLSNGANQVVVSRASIGLSHGHIPSELKGLAVTISEEGGNLRIEIPPKTCLWLQL